MYWHGMYLGVQIVIIKKGIIVRIPICFHKLTEQILDNQVTSHMISFNSVSVSIGMEYVIEEWRILIDSKIRKYSFHQFV